MTKKSLTRRQQKILLAIECAIRIEREDLQKHMEKFGIEGTPSDSVSVLRLRKTHNIAYRDIDALVKKGCLKTQPSDGCGPMVSIAQ